MHQLNPSKFNESELILDEKRRKVLDVRSMNAFQNLLYRRNFFKTMRPDLNNLDYYVFKEKWLLGENLFNEMKRKLNLEILRMHMQTPFAFRRKKMTQAFNEQVYALSVPHIRGCRYHADRTWDEATKIVNYVDKTIQKINKYGLQYPMMVEEVDQRDKEKIETEVMERFVREMRKPVKEETKEE